jgi:hypothetical protein
MTERWFDDAALRDMSVPTMDLLTAALDDGRLDDARDLAQRMKSEWAMLHDLLVEMIAGLITYVQRSEGDDGVPRAWEACFEQSWRHHAEKVDTLDRRQVVELLAATWRAHSTSGVGRFPGSFSVSEDDEKFTFRMLPCGSGQRLVLKGRYEGPRSFGRTDEAHDWSYGRAGFPLYCTHCSFMNEILPMRWLGYPLYPSAPPDDFATDPCVWYWFKDPARIPESFTARYRQATVRPAGETAAPDPDR